MGTKEYHALKSREHYQRRSQDPEWLKTQADYKASKRRDKKAEVVKQFGGVCHHCKDAFPDCVFDFHHLDHSEKEYTPAHLFGRRDVLIQAELLKCIMLCSNCHRIEHMKDNYAAHSQRYE